MNVTVSSSRDGEKCDLRALEGVAAFALAAEKAPAGSEVSIALVDNEAIARLNSEYRNKKGPTDVLSFECDSKDDEALIQEDGSEFLMLGDIVIAPEVARVQAQEYNATFEEEMDLLVVHGVLHLLGYDHTDDAEADVMEARESAILRDWWVAQAKAKQ